MAKKKSTNMGYILVYRSIWNNEMWQSSEAFDRRSAWIDLILMANHESRSIILQNGRRLEIGRGQLFTSYRSLADRWHWSVNKVKRYFTLLCELHMVTKSGTQSGTLVTIEKYDTFQDGRHTNEHTNEPSDGLSDEPSGGPRTNNLQRTNTKNVSKKEAAPQFESDSWRTYE